MRLFASPLLQDLHRERDQRTHRERRHDPLQPITQVHGPPRAVPVLAVSPAHPGPPYHPYGW